MNEKELCNKVESVIGNLFNPEFPKKDSILYSTKYGICQAGTLLSAAIRTANAGVDQENYCQCCFEVSELLQAYKDIVDRTLEAAEGEEFRRRKPRKATKTEKAA